MLVNIYSTPHLPLTGYHDTRPLHAFHSSEDIENGFKTLRYAKHSCFGCLPTAPGGHDDGDGDGGDFIIKYAAYARTGREEGAAGAATTEL